MTDFLEAKRKEIRDRLKELKPAVDEYARLEAAATALAGVGSGTGAPAAARPGKRGPGRPRGSGASRAATGSKAAGKSTRRGPGRPEGSGSRAEEALKLIQSRPGIKIPEIAAALSMQPNYLYRVMPTLVKEKKVRKEGQGWHPVAA